MDALVAHDFVMPVISSHRRWFAIVVAMALGGVAAVAQAQAGGTGPDVAAASRAFSAAQAAELAGDPGRAAELYELADQIAPSPEALRSAVRMRQAAGEPALAATRAEAMLQRYPTDEVSSALATEILQQVRPSLARYRVTCRPACSLAIDGSASSADARADHVAYTNPGNHSLVVTFPDQRSRSQSVTATAGSDEALSFVPPPRPPSGETRSGGRTRLPGSRRPERARTGDESRGWSPLVVVAGSVVTLGLGVATIWSGLDTADARDVYVETPTLAGYDEGVVRERRTNVLIAATAVTGVVTLGVAIFGTDWGGAPPGRDRARASVSVGAGPGELGLAVHGGF